MQLGRQEGITVFSRGCGILLLLVVEVDEMPTLAKWVTVGDVEERVNFTLVGDVKKN